MVLWRGVQLSGVGCFFKPAIELIKMACQLLILHSAGRWCCICIWFSLSDISILMRSHWKRIGSLSVGHYELCRDNIWDFIWKPRLSLT